jgi:hypothetical protein
MKIEQQFSDPEHVQDRQPYRLRIEGKDGQVIEIVEQMGGGFSIASGRPLIVLPIMINQIVVKAPKP